MCKINITNCVNFINSFHSVKVLDKNNEIYYNEIVIKKTNSSDTEASDVKDRVFLHSSQALTQKHT